MAFYIYFSILNIFLLFKIFTLPGPDLGHKSIKLFKEPHYRYLYSMKIARINHLNLMVLLTNNCFPYFYFFNQFSIIFLYSFLIDNT